MKYLTTYEASRKYHLSTSHLRRLLLEGQIKGSQRSTGENTKIWLIDEPSLIKYKKSEPKRGPKKKK